MPKSMQSDYDQYVIFIPFASDVYEVTFDMTSVLSIVRYPSGREQRGELIPYESLSVQLQEKIFTHLRHELTRIKGERDQGGKK